MAGSDYSPEKVSALLRRLRAAEKALHHAVHWYGKNYCPFCIHMDGTHTPDCLYAAWLAARKDFPDDDDP